VTVKLNTVKEYSWFH